MAVLLGRVDGRVSGAVRAAGTRAPCAATCRISRGELPVIIESGDSRLEATTVETSVSFIIDGLRVGTD